MIPTRLLVGSSCKSLDSNGFLMEIFRYILYVDFFSLVPFSLNFSIGVRILVCHLLCLPNLSFCGGC